LCVCVFLFLFLCVVYLSVPQSQASAILPFFPPYLVLPPPSGRFEDVEGRQTRQSACLPSLPPSLPPDRPLSLCASSSCTSHELPPSLPPSQHTQAPLLLVKYIHHTGSQRRATLPPSLPPSLAAHTGRLFAPPTMSFSHTTGKKGGCPSGET
jgi:hypothetical protein